MKAAKKEQVQYHLHMQAKLLFETCEEKYANSMKFLNQEDLRLTYYSLIIQSRLI